MAKRDVIYNQKVFSISYELANPSKEKSLLFLHGWGSKKELMKQAFGKYFNDYKHIYVDMPGFGASSTDEILVTDNYKDIMNNFLHEIEESPSAIFGHSFGGKVATLMNPKNLVLLSSAGIVEEKPLKVKLKIALFKVLKPLGSQKIARFFASDDVKGMPQNMYETMKRVVNEDFTDHFRSYKGNAQIFWGVADKATTLPAGELISTLIRNSKFFPLEGDHFFFLKQGKEIEEKITL